MQITGIVTHILEMRTGENSRGEWAVQQYVLETQERFPQRFLFNVFGKDKIEQYNISENDNITVTFYVDARENKGIWYASNIATDITVNTPQ